MDLGGAPTIGPAVLGGGLGFLWGLAADRLAARWPAKTAGVRSVDWRTAVTVASTVVALAAVGFRFASEPATAVLLGCYVAALGVLLATDLDQRLLPDPITLPLVVYALGLDLGGANPLLGPLGLGGAIAAALVYPALLYGLSLPFGPGALGFGDVKLLVSAGLVLGLERGLVAVLAGALAAGVVIAVLLIGRRISLRSYVPFGPFLILGVIWAIVGPG